MKVCIYTEEKKKNHIPKIESFFVSEVFNLKTTDFNQI